MHSSCTFDICMTSQLHNPAKMFCIRIHSGIETNVYVKAKMFQSVMHLFTIVRVTNDCSILFLIVPNVGLKQTECTVS